MQLLGLRQARPGAGVAVERGLLVRVLAVAQHRRAAPAAGEPLREGGLTRLLGRQLGLHPARDGDVVLRGVLKGQ